MPNNSPLPLLPYPIPSLFSPQKLFIGPKGLPEFETSMSPTSTLETKHLSTQWRRLGGLVDILQDDNDPKSFLFGSQLKIQLPSLQSTNHSPPQSPIEFGVNTRDSISLRSPDATRPMVVASISPELLTDIEMSEDYTCVISHGPNPKTTHIFDNCIVQECCGGRRGFLTYCHACNKNLLQGSDIFIYRGEKAFCSEECRSREMMLDEGKPKFELAA